MPEVNEDFFFILIDSVKINKEEYVKFIEDQKIAQINTYVHQALLQQW